MLMRRRCAQPGPLRAARPNGGAIRCAWITGVLAGLLAASVAVAPPASAAPIDSTGTVVRVVDGDTVIANIGGAEHRIRITGLNTMEISEYEKGHREGECRGRQATRRLEELVLNKTVRITARRASSASGERHRLRRSLEVTAGGRTVDPAAVLIREGLALWMPNQVEFRPNAEYPVLAAEAAAARRGLWQADGCGVGPSPDAALRVTVKPRGAETVTISNAGAGPVDLTGWWLRDSSFHGVLARGYEFRSKAVLPAGGTIVLHTGRGADHDNHRYWNLPNPVFDNPTGGPQWMGDGAYLFDPRGNLRAAHQYAPHAPIQFP